MLIKVIHYEIKDDKGATFCELRENILIPDTARTQSVHPDTWTIFTPSMSPVTFVGFQLTSWWPSPERDRNIKYVS